jgi:hypothetical protein
MANVIMVSDRAKAHSLYLDHARRFAVLMRSKLGLGAKPHPPLSRCRTTTIGACKNAGTFIFSQSRKKRQYPFPQRRGEVQPLTSGTRTGGRIAMTAWGC